ncbi:MAG: Lantibiotic dehydratase domain protein [Mucilaginibacter sp.]|nr:Lantibiotic dehydratase domain protein [Mucilaginibacter sp.]
MPVKMNYNFGENLVIRTPMLALNNLSECSFEEILNNPVFREALFIASPEFARNLYYQKTINNENINESVITKYYNRMCHRCTPFGLFAGCAVAQWGENTSLDLESHSITRRTRLDKDFLAKLINHLTLVDPVFLGLKIYLNNTLYKVGEEYRYVEKTIKEDGSTEYNLSTIHETSHLLDFIKFTAKGNVRVATVLAKAVNAGYSKSKAFNYLKTLYLNNVVVTNLDVACPANELLIKCKNVLGEIAKNDKTYIVTYWHKYLKEITRLLTALDKNIDGDLSKYDKLFKHIDKSELKQAANRILQVDYAYKGLQGNISRRIKSSLSQGIDVLTYINIGGAENIYLENFKKKFVRKYDAQEIPFLTALDPETGIDYFEGTSSAGHLRNELAITKPKPALDFSELNANLKPIFYKYEKAVRSNNLVIELTDKDLQQMKKAEINFPATTSVFFRIFGDNKIQIENIGGSSSINLFTRFTDFSVELKKIALEVTTYEQEFNLDYIMAEVIHEPQARNANVTAHPSLRQFEIPYIGQSSKSGGDVITLNDLFISVVNNRLVLRSKKHKKEILPQLNHAFNYLKGSPIYRFLGDYQFNGYTDGLKFDFRRILPDKLFYPRLQYKEIVLSPATWLIRLKDINEEFGDFNCQKILHYLKLKKVERYFIVFEYDNELLIDITNTPLLIIFKEILQKKREVLIKEFLYDDSVAIAKNASGQLINNQAIAILKSSDIKNLRSPVQFRLLKKKAIPRNFSLGSEWIYYKIYCGTYIGDKILIEKILPLVKEQKKKKIISGFFFIRYLDPDPHLRIRFKLRNINLINSLITDFHKSLVSLETTGCIWKIQTETYSRELERYGAAMKASEAIFAIDSYAILRLLSIKNIVNEDNTRIAVGIKLIADLISCMNLDIGQKIIFCKQSRMALKSDCKLDVTTEVSISNSYKEKHLLYGLFLKQNSMTSLFNRRYSAIMKVFSKINKKVSLGTLDVEANNLLRSHVHMCVNRLFLTDQKIYEYTIYDYLYKFFNKIKNDPASMN